MAKKALPPEVEARVRQTLAQTDWSAQFPQFVDRMTAYRAAKEQITARVLADLAQQQAREAADAQRKAQAELARVQGGYRYGS